MPEHTAVRGKERFLGERQESENGGTHEQKTTRDRAHTGRRLALHDGGAAQTGKCLIRKTCCNYENGNCLLLDDG